ncbi:MAG: hypothetical protein M0Z54_07505 [Thermaerobacter sp.]|nr:hypothetical protein [Thermaerobacter sp.]
MTPATVQDRRAQVLAAAYATIPLAAFVRLRVLRRRYDMGDEALCAVPSRRPSSGCPYGPVQWLQVTGTRPSPLLPTGTAAIFNVDNHEL